MKERLNKILNYSGLNKKYFAEKINVTPVALNNYFNKDRLPTTETLLNIKQAFNNISIDWLLTGQGKMLLDHTQQQQKSEAKQEISSLLEDLKVQHEKEKDLLLENNNLLKENNDLLRKEIHRLQTALAKYEEKKAVQSVKEPHTV